MDELLDEIGQVVALREAGQLVRVLQPRVHHEVDLPVDEALEELFCRSLVSADGVDVHERMLLRVNRFLRYVTPSYAGARSQRRTVDKTRSLRHCAAIRHIFPSMKISPSSISIYARKRTDCVYNTEGMLNGSLKRSALLGHERSAEVVRARRATVLRRYSVQHGRLPVHHRHATRYRARLRQHARRLRPAGQPRSRPHPSLERTHRRTRSEALR